MGKDRYWLAGGMLLLCDCGGSDGYRRHRFKEDLVELAADSKLPIEVAHYPPGCSKFHPIERRMFCHNTGAARHRAANDSRRPRFHQTHHDDNRTKGHRRDCPPHLRKRPPSDGRFPPPNANPSRQAATTTELHGAGLAHHPRNTEVIFRAILGASGTWDFSANPWLGRETGHSMIADWRLEIGEDQGSIMTWVAHLGGYMRQSTTLPPGHAWQCWRW
jgi:hypothetical protein